MSTVTYEPHDTLAVVRMDDGKVNAMAMPFFDGLNAALDRAERDKPGAVVITGRAGAFSAGLNLKVLPTLPPDELKATLTTFGRTLLRVFTFPIPTVAAVSGHAIAGGAFLMMACDLRYVAEGAWKTHANEVAIGLVLPTWAIVIAEQAIPPRYHTEALLHARPYLPEEALERQIIHGVAPAERLLDVALAAAAPLGALDQASYATSKRRQRALRVEWASKLVDQEMVGLPKR
jgi:enoyl-CoA hydratase